MDLGALPPAETQVDMDAFLNLACRHFKTADDIACAICHEAFGMTAAKLLPCATFSSCPSFYHSRCLLLWLDRQLSCPLCRRSFAGQLGVSHHHFSSAPLNIDFPATPVSPNSPFQPPSPYDGGTDTQVQNPASWEETVLPVWRVRDGGAAASRSLAQPVAAIETSPSPQRHLATPSRGMSLAQHQLSSVGIRRTNFAITSPVRTGMPWLADRRRAELPGRSSANVQLFTQMDRVDLDTRRTLQRRVAALHRQQLQAGVR